MLGESLCREMLARIVSRLCEGGSAPSPQRYKPSSILSMDGQWGDPLAPDAAVPGQQLWHRSALVSRGISPGVHCGTGITSVTHVTSAGVTRVETGNHRWVLPAPCIHRGLFNREMLLGFLQVRTGTGFCKEGVRSLRMP